MNFNKNKLINAVLRNYYNTFSFTLDTSDFVPQKFNKKIHNYIYKNMKKKFKEIDKEDKKFQKELKLKNKVKKEKTFSVKLCFIMLKQKLRYLYLKKKHRLLDYKENENLEIKNEEE